MISEDPLTRQALDEEPAEDDATGLPLDETPVTSDEILYLRMRLLRDCQSRIAERSATFASARKVVLRDLALIDEAEERANAEDIRTAALLEGQACAYMAQVRQAGLAKSIDTPWGRVESHQGQDVWVPESEGTLLGFAREHVEGEGENIHRPFLREKFTQEPDIRALRSGTRRREDRLVVKATGETIPGVRVDEGPITYKVKLYE